MGQEEGAAVQQRIQGPRHGAVGARQLERYGVHRVECLSIDVLSCIYGGCLAPCVLIYITGKLYSVDDKSGIVFEVSVAARGVV